MKLIYVGTNFAGFKENQVHNFRVRRELKNFIEKNFDKVEDEELLMEVKMKETIYWDFCPFEIDVGDGTLSFVWGLEKEALQEYIKRSADDI